MILMCYQIAATQKQYKNINILATNFNIEKKAFNGEVCDWKTLFALVGRCVML